MDRFKVCRKRTLYIGDMASDILTAKFAGVDALRQWRTASRLYEGLKAARAKSRVQGHERPAGARLKRNRAYGRL